MQIVQDVMSVKYGASESTSLVLVSNIVPLGAINRNCLGLYWAKCLRIF
jgi:hypothetical protein